MSERTIFFGYSLVEINEIGAILEMKHITYYISPAVYRSKWLTSRSRFARNARGNFRIGKDGEQLFEICVNEKDYKEACYLLLKYKNFKNT